MRSKSAASRFSDTAYEPSMNPSYQIESADVKPFIMRKSSELLILKRKYNIILTHQG